MNLLYYTPEGYGPGKRLMEALDAVAPRERFSICHGVDDLSRLLREPGAKPDVAVFFPSSRKELTAMLRIRELFVDIRIILVLPGESEDMVSEALTLHPRYLDNSDRGFNYVAAVFRKTLTLIPNDDVMEMAGPEGGEKGLEKAP